jgi:hypothetical protein
MWKQIRSDAEWFMRTPVLLSEDARISESAASSRESLLVAPRPRPRCRATFIPFDPSIRNIFTQPNPDQIRHPYFIALTAADDSATWYLHTPSGHFIYCEDVDTLFPFPVAPSLRDSMLHVGNLDPLRFKIEAAAALAQKFQSANGRGPLDYLAQSAALQCRYPPVTLPTLTFYQPVVSSPNFLDAVAKLPLPRGDIDGFLSGWIAACGANLGRVWPVLVFMEIKKTGRVQTLFARGSFLELIVQFLFLSDVSFAEAIATSPQTSPAAVAEFFRAIAVCKIGALPRWLLSVVLCEAEQRFPKARAACVCFANLIFRSLIAPVLVARSYDAETAVRFMESVFAFSPAVRAGTITAMTDMVDHFKANVELGEMEAVRVEHVKSLVAKAFADPAAFRKACDESTFDADRVAYTRALNVRRYFDM